MIISIIVNFAAGHLIERYRRKRIVAAAVGLNLGILGFYKYANFLTENINSLFATVNLAPIDLAPVHLPLGISFFTFQAISYLIDIYRQEISAQTNILKLGLYISLFPQLIAGPIVRYKTINSDIDNRKVTASLFASGAERFVIGLGKKMLIANPLGAVVDIIFAVPPDQLPAHIAWLGVLLYALQIYFDFSGYSDMAIGLARMLGFKLLENFNYPYIATSIREFWRRWHISLSSWFRDYLYIPLGGNRASPIRVYTNLFIVFLLCGLWHGASWNFIVWGAFHGLFLAIERSGFGAILSRTWAPIQHLYVVFVVLISWVFFRAESLSDAITYTKAMFSWNMTHIPFEVVEVLDIKILAILLIGLVASAPIYTRRRMLMTNQDDLQGTEYTIGFSGVLWVIGVLALVMMTLASNTHNPFIYFRF